MDDLRFSRLPKHSLNIKLSLSFLVRRKGEQTESLPFVLSRLYLAHNQLFERLGISNGTAFSASAACLAAHDAHFLGLMSQVLTAMTVEAMVGQAGNYHRSVLF